MQIERGGADWSQVGNNYWINWNYLEIVHFNFELPWGWLFYMQQEKVPKHVKVHMRYKYDRTLAYPLFWL